MYVDDLLFSGTEGLRRSSKSFDESIKMTPSPAYNTPLTFAGLRIKRESDGTMTMNQEEYIKSL